IAGFLLAIGVAAIYVGCLHGSIDQAFWMFVTRWLHVASGVMWIGLLWYFNFVQVPTMPSVPAELKPGVTKYIAPAALFWFRWAALATVLLGLILAESSQPGYVGQALMFKPGFKVIGTGMWLGIVMAADVWLVI